MERENLDGDAKGKAQVAQNRVIIEMEVHYCKSKSCACRRTCSNMAMCKAFGSRTEPSRRNAFGQHACNLAELRESPLANKTTSCPKATRSSVSHEMTRSVPP